MKVEFEKLKEEYIKCERCKELCANRRQVVFGTGDPKAKILLLGEAPGAMEDQQGIPFCGQAGKVLNELLEKVGLSREKIFITNTVICRPPGNRNPTSQEIENCRERLDRLVEMIKPKVIVTIGNFATERMIGKTGINKLRGRVFPSLCGLWNVKVVPMIHPASYLYSGRNPELFKKMLEDLEMATKINGDTEGQRRLGEF